MNLEGRYEELVNFTDELINFLSNYEDVIDSQNINFMINDNWQKLSESKQRQLLFYARTNQLDQIPPGTLLLSEFCEHQKADDKHCIICYLKQIQKYSLVHPNPHVLDFQNFSWFPLSQSGLKVHRPSGASKKEHEIDAMASLIFGLLSKCQSDRVVDVGSGLGYLDSLLAVSNDTICNVIGLEISQHNADKAQIRHGSLLGRDCKICKEEWSSNCRSLQSQGLPIPNRKWKICTHDTKVNNFCSVLQKVDCNLDIDQIVSDSFQPGKDAKDSFVIAGLHTCGNLASDALRLFVRSDKCNALCLVPCCHNLLKEHFNKGISRIVDHNAEPGFPLSRHLYEKRFSVGLNFREIATQSPFKVSPTPTVAIFYRCLLQKLLLEFYGYLDKDWEVGRAKKCMTKSFADYVHHSLNILKPLLPLDSKKNPADEWTPDFLSHYEAQHAEEKMKLHAFQYYRMALAPSVESLLILDKILFLLEEVKNGDLRLVRLFDPKKSPRCLALVMLKGN